jgi:Protein of unknown function (DUF2568)
VRPANAGLRFVLELCALAAVAYWGWTETSGPLRWLLVIGTPFAVALVWGRWIAPKAARPLRDPLRLAVELLVFGSAVAALVRTHEPVLAIVLAGATSLHLALTFLLGQRRTG